MGLLGGEVAGAEAHRVGTVLASRAHAVGGPQPAPTELLHKHDFGAGEVRAEGLPLSLPTRIPRSLPSTLCSLTFTSTHEPLGSTQVVAWWWHSGKDPGLVLLMSICSGRSRHRSVLEPGEQTG